MIMLFRKDITRCCAYCQYADTERNGSLKCSKKGSVEEDNSCLFFRYDPLKRKPVKAKAMDFTQYSEDDFKL